MERLADGLGVQEKYDEAEKLAREAVKIFRRALGDSHPSFATGLSTLASILRAQNKLDEAEDLMREALGVYQRAYGPIHKFVADHLSDLSQLLEAKVGYGFTGC